MVIIIILVCFEMNNKHMFYIYIYCGRIFGMLSVLDVYDPVFAMRACIGVGQQKLTA